MTKSTVSSSVWSECSVWNLGERKITMSNCMRHYEKSKGMFKTLLEEKQELVKEASACFHCRTGVKQPDGSMGEIRITLKEMNDILAYVYLKGRYYNE